MKGVNPAAVLAIWRRQLGSLLLNPLGYIFIGVFVVVTVGILLIPESFFYRNIADLGPLYAYMPWLLVVLLPALGMGAWASERELGTEEQLLTLPLTVSDALLGKWLGVTAYWTLALACSLSVVGVLAWLGEPDYGLIFSNYVGWWCAGLLFGAASVLASSLVGLPAIAFVLGVLLSASLMALAHALDWFDPFNRGLIPLGRLVQTAVAIYFLLGAAMVSVNARRWSTATVPFLGVVMTLLLFGYCAVCVILVLRETYRGPLLAPIGFVLLAAWGLAMVPRHLLLHAAAFVGLGVTLVNFGVQSDRAAVDWDTTGERLSSLSGASLDVLKQLKRPVKITAFISKDLPAQARAEGQGGREHAEGAGP
ncbi:MAG: hypothetical protein M5U26_24400 [Planctomycetota bacterium]|nr:hypothetical protein [Planctomycetota bacterium]